MHKIFGLVLTLALAPLAIAQTISINGIGNQGLTGVGSAAQYTSTFHSSGSDICAWITAAGAALPAGGGVISTNGEAIAAGSNTCSSATTKTMFASANANKSIVLMLGAQTMTVPSQIVIPKTSRIQGMAPGYVNTMGSTINASSAFVGSVGYTAVSCTSGICTVTTSATINAFVGMQVLMVPSSGTRFAQIISAVPTSTTFQFPSWINCNVPPNSVSCTGGYDDSTYYSGLTTGTVVVPIVAVGDQQFSERTRVDDLEINGAAITTGSSLPFFSQTVNENGGGSRLNLQGCTYECFDFETGGNSATLGARNYDFEYIEAGPTAGICGFVMTAFATDVRGIHEITCGASTQLASGIVLDSPSGENGPFHFENFVDGVVLQQSFTPNASGAGEGLGQAFTLLNVTCYTNVTNCVHNISGTNTPTNFRLRDIRRNGATSVYLNSAGTATTGSTIVDTLETQ